MKEIIFGTWPWYVAGPLIALNMLFLVWMGKSFGISAVMRTICCAGGAGKTCQFFNFDWRRDSWNLLFVVGGLIGGFIGYFVLSPDGFSVPIAEVTLQKIKDLGVSYNAGYVPNNLLGAEALTTASSLLVIVAGGFFIGFGARYAGGCTSGHAITGLADLQLPSLIAVIGFFVGGLIATHFILPYIL